MLNKTVSVKSIIILIVMLLLVIYASHDFSNKLINTDNSIIKDIEEDWGLEGIMIVNKEKTDNVLVVFYTFNDGYGLNIYKSDRLFKFLYYSIYREYTDFNGYLDIDNNDYLYQTNKNAYVLFYGYNPQAFDQIHIDIESLKYQVDLSYTFNYSKQINYYFEIEKVNVVPREYDEIEVSYE